MAGQSDVAIQEKKLRSRIKSFYEHLNQRDWQSCFDSIDPKLRDGRIAYADYAETLTTFFQKYGPINILSLKVSLHLDVKNSKRGEKDFAYGSVSWKDRENHIREFRERWIRSADDQWYTRMVGLV